MGRLTAELVGTQSSQESATGRPFVQDREATDVTIAGSDVPVVRHVELVASGNLAAANDWPETSDAFPKGYDWEALAEFD